jgi:hypothetical protein
MFRTVLTLGYCPGIAPTGSFASTGIYETCEKKSQNGAYGTRKSRSVRAHIPPGRASR